VHGLGKCLLASNSLLYRALIQGHVEGEHSLDFLCNCTKQIIADHNFYIYQKIYRSYFLFSKFYRKYLKDYDIEKKFQDKFGLNIQEYFAFLFLLFGKYIPNHKNGEGPDDMPALDIQVALKNLKNQYTRKLLNNLIFKENEYTNVDTSFYNIIPFAQKPLIKLQDEKLIPINLRCLFLGITESLYFDIFDSLPKDEQKIFSTYFGYAIEDYFQDIIKQINDQTIFYDRDKAVPDAIIKEENAVLFFECKKRQFHTLQFLQYGTKKIYLERINEFFFKPLNQLCNRIKDFRAGKFTIEGIDHEKVKIYPIVVSPSAPPIFSGGWDIHDLNQYILPEYYNEDKNIEPPEFMDFDELESIEAYLQKNSKKSFIDLISIKRSDLSYHNANWMVILKKNGMDYRNKRLLEEYINESKQFHGLLFKNHSTRP